MDYDAIHNPSYYGRGKVHFTAPLNANGSVNTKAYGTRWGNNWAALPATPGELGLAIGRFVGNCKALTVMPQVQRANTSGWDTRDNLIVEGVEASVTLYGHGSLNLADALHAMRTQVQGEPRTQQFAVGSASLEEGCMLMTRHLIDQSKPISVQASWTPWVEGVHWAREAFGARLLSGFSAPTSSTISITYTPDGSAESLDALGNTALELGLVYTGVNRANGLPIRLDCYRAQPTLGESLQPISESTGTLTLKFNLRPVSLGGAHRPRWFRVLAGQHNRF